ncbi:hypothetical protein Trydic_g477 [Trypoxylus dichotomus]
MKVKDFVTKLKYRTFQRRHDIAFKKAAGESRYVDLAVCSQWTENLPTLLEGYDPDLAGLFQIEPLYLKEKRVVEKNKVKSASLIFIVQI